MSIGIGFWNWHGVLFFIVLISIFRKLTFFWDDRSFDVVWFQVFNIGLLIVDFHFEVFLLCLKSLYFFLQSGLLSVVEVVLRMGLNFLLKLRDISLRWLELEFVVFKLVFNILIFFIVEDLASRNIALTWISSVPILFLPNIFKFIGQLPFYSYFFIKLVLNYFIFCQELPVDGL